MNINDRLRELIKTLGLNKTQLAKETGLNYTTLDSVINEKTNNKPSFDTLSAILLTYRQVDPDWLIHGIGDVFRKMEITNSEKWNLQKNELNEDPPQYKPDAKPKQDELSEKRYELLLIEMEAIRKRVEMVEKALKQKK